MKRIYKYKLEITDVQTILMPRGASILTVQLQEGEPHVWALVNPEYAKEEIVIHTYGTGSPIETPGKLYIGTYQLNGFVWHVFQS